jgi:hypothetical protein
MFEILIAKREDAELILQSVKKLAIAEELPFEVSDKRYSPRNAALRKYGVNLI